MQETAHMDRLILALRQKYKEEQSVQDAIGEDIFIGMHKVALYRESLFGETCSMLFPESLRDMPYSEILVKYPGTNRPQIIKTDRSGNASITFSTIPMEDVSGDEEVLNKLKKIRGDMKKVWKQNVFYDMGEVQTQKLTVAWMDFKTYTLTENIYCIIFIFRLGEEMVLGNFHCSLSVYDIWKPAVLKLLTTIQTKEQGLSEKR